MQEPPTKQQTLDACRLIRVADNVWPAMDAFHAMIRQADLISLEMALDHASEPSRRVLAHAIEDVFSHGCTPREEPTSCPS